MIKKTGLNQYGNETEQVVCKCGSEWFQIITKIHLDESGSHSGKDLRFKCIDCGKEYTQWGDEVNAEGSVK